MDVYAQYRFLDPSIFGTNYTQFKERYQNIDLRRSMAVGYTILDKKQPYKNLDELREKVFSIAFKIPSSVKLPRQNNRVRHFCLSEKASRVYTRLCEDGILKNGEWYCEAENSLTMQIRKRQVASGFVSTVNDTMDKKLFRLDTARKETLKDLLEALEPSEPVVVFAQYTYDLRQVKAACEELGRGYSELSGRVDSEAEWQEGKTTVLGVQFSKGSEGVDFTRARYCIYYTMTDRLALYLQSKKRIHRPGQTRPVYYFHFVADMANGKPTIDSTVIEAVRLKRDIVEYVMEKEGNTDDL
jgi:SNF2 family DNA or RNA helicase